MIDKYKDDDKAFIFTLKNPFGVEPTRFMKREESTLAIICWRECGPRFGSVIYIGNYCNDNNSCDIENDDNGEYDCHPIYRSSLFVNTSGPDERNSFSILDYEVYTH